MKIQTLAVIFIIIMLPISLVLTAYVQNQVETLELQISYDTKLTNATYDALKAFQLNTINSDTSDLANSKLRDIEASVNTFFNSISTNFNMAGYNQDILKEYVPALVYTMYDGYYIYSPFTNTLGEEDYISENQDGVTPSTYQDGEKLSGLKPYIFYSCRYQKGANTDIVITYSLDNYITIEGLVNGTPVYKYGYLLDNIGGYNEGNNTITYRGITIGEETLQEYTDSNYTEGKTIYTKINGVKYYYNENTGKWNSILNEYEYEQPEIYKEETDAAVRYYRQAQEFTSWVYSNLGGLKTSDAVYIENGQLKHDLAQKEQWGDYSIFSDGENSIEDPNSNFNEHRLQIIRYSIEKNLSIAIANYNNYSGVTANFQMPELQEHEWEKIINNVSIISFMQGLSIGGKIYNGYSIVTNTKTEEVVNTDSIYITTKDMQYHRATDKDLTNYTSDEITGAYFNVDFERKSIVSEDNSIRYFFPHNETGCYSSIVNQSGVNDVENIYEYMESIKGRIAEVYFTALGRERYSMYKTNNNPEVLKLEFVQ